MRVTAPGMAANHPQPCSTRFQADIEVAVGHGIPHAISGTPRHLWIGRNEVRVMPPNILGSFANDLQVADHRVLRLGIKQESRMIQAVGIGTDSFDPR